MTAAGDRPDRLGPAARAATVEELASTDVDVVVIGGGVTGAGCALDAASRGLRVALLEQRDLASGTSSRSSKLIHGGLRYLEQFDLRLVFEAIGERSLLLDELAPHLVRPVSFLFPLRRRIVERLYVGAGVLLYDLFARRRRQSLPFHRHLSRRGAARLAPGLDAGHLVGAIRYWDAQVDDARHTLAVARTAAAHGAHVLTSARVIGVRRDGERVTGVHARCLETGRDLEIGSGAVISAAGVWTDDIATRAGARGLTVRASKGIHLVVPRDTFDSGTGIILRTETSVLFVIEWDDHWIIGTTDTDWDLDRAHPAASSRDIDYLLEQVNRITRRPLTRDDVQGVYAGLRPLLSGETEETSELSREHAVTVSPPGLVTVAGGKYTTYRIMARDAVDAAVTELGRDVPASSTGEIALVGTTGYRAERGARETRARRAGLGEGAIAHLESRHGALSGDIVALVEENPRWAAPLAAGHPYLEAEVVYAVRAEAALHLDDVLTRRTRLSIESWDRGTAVAERTAELMGDELGWSAADRAREVTHYSARVAAERDSQTRPDDETADAARLGAPDVRRGAR